MPVREIAESAPETLPEPLQEAAQETASPHAPEASFAEASVRDAFEKALLAGTVADSDDRYAEVEAWARALQDAGAIDATIQRLSVAADVKNAPPQVSFALAALYGRKGLIQKQYACLVRAEQAAKSRPDIVFAIAAVYGRKDALKANYSADELLVGTFTAETEPAGARVLVDGAERGSSPLSIEKLREGQHRLRLESEGFEAWEAAFDVETGHETKVAVKLGAKPGSIEVSLTPAAKVKVDGGQYEDAPHVFDGLAPGQHSLQFWVAASGRRYYDAHDDATVTVSPGQRVSFKRTFPIGRSKLQVADAPTASTVFVDGARMDPAVFGKGVDLESGAYSVKVFSPSGQEWYQDCNLYPGAVSSIKIADMGVILARRSIKLDGKVDSWGDLEPYQAKALVGKGILSGYDCKNIYVCRDAKFLYWRMDFADSSPFYNHPKKIVKDLIAQMTVHWQPKKYFNSVVVYARSGNQMDAFRDYYDEGTKMGNRLGENTATYKSTSTMFVMRMSLSGLAKYLYGPQEVSFGYGHRLKDNQWESGGMWTVTRNIDFSQ